MKFMTANKPLMMTVSRFVSGQAAWNVALVVDRQWQSCTQRLSVTACLRYFRKVFVDMESSKVSTSLSPSGRKWAITGAILGWIMVLASANESFPSREVKFYTAFEQGTKSVVFSPFSVCSSLYQTAILASGETASEILSALGLKSEELETLNQIYDDISFQLNLHGLEGGVSYLDPLLAIAHGSNLIFLKSISELIPRREVPAVLLEHGRFTPERIRRYVLQRTNERIDIQVHPDSLKPETLLVVSTMVVQAEWQTLFYIQRTYQHPFQSLTEHGYLKAKVDMMTDVRTVAWKQDHRLGVDVAAVPLKDPDLLFIIVLPHDRSGFANVEHAILKESDVLVTIFEGLEPKLVRLGIPRFRIDTTLYMREGLESLGMGQAFDPSRADFSHLSNASQGKLYLSDMVHAAAIEVNEQGVSPSAAATPIQLGHPLGLVPPDYSFIADHPFLFFIRHTVVGRTLLSGKYLGPSGSPEQTSADMSHRHSRRY